MLCKSGKRNEDQQEEVEKYQRGSKPTAFIEQEEIDYFKKMAVELISEFEKEWNAGSFKEFQAFTTSMGVRIETCKEVLHYAAGHDQLHFGYCLLSGELFYINH
ncbi:MAG: hypothetical protein WDO16_17300 [Bacteroidota bacterium]